MTHYQIREIVPWDEPAFCAMVEAFYRLPAVAHPIPPAHAARTFALLFQDTPYARCFVVADADNHLYGYCLCAITWSNEAGGLCVWLEELYLKEELRGHGLGTALIDTVRAAYPDAARFRLEVTAANTRAAQLYQSLGFTSLPYEQLVLDVQGEKA